MTRISLPETRQLDHIHAHLLERLQSTARALSFDIILIGALARDLLLEHLHNIKTWRATRDVDIAVCVPTWDAYKSLKTNLIATGEFTPTPNVEHRLRHGKLWVDIVPFGDIEAGNRTIAWPPGNSEIMNTLGLREAAEYAIQLEVAPGMVISIVTLPALAALKIFAWEDRKNDGGARDAHDLALIAANYVEAGNENRLYGDPADLLNAKGFNYQLAGATLLGRDIAAQLGADISKRLLQIIDREIDINSAQQLVHNMVESQAQKADRWEFCTGLLSSIRAGLQAVG